MVTDQAYALSKLFRDLPVPITEVARMSGLNEVTVARIRDGKKTRVSTANKLLKAMSQIYGYDLNLDNVTGINVQGINEE